MVRSRIRVLGAAFAAVPGSSPHGASMSAMIDALRCELDLVTIKTENLSHTKRIGDARMFRVPVGAGPARKQQDIYARAVARQIEAEAYQIVHVMDPWAGVAAAERHEARRYTLLYEITSLPDPSSETEGSSAERARWLEAHELTLRTADRVLVPSVAAARSLERRGLSGRVDVVRPGIDVGRFDWSEVQPTRVPRLLYLGPLSAVRDVDALIDAVTRVAAHRPVSMLMAGEPSRARRAAVRERIARAGLAAVIEVHGEPDPLRIPRLISTADVCLAPAAEHEIAGCVELPQPLLEYLACYRPVVAADIPGVSELVRDEVEGLLYPPGDSAAMADAVLELLRDAVLRERLTEAGYRRVRDELNSGARRRRVQQIYELLAPGSQSTDSWGDAFEEVTGLFELSTSAIARLSEDPATPKSDTHETHSPTEPAPPQARGQLAAAETAVQPRSTDTQPGFVLPDTDPGRS